MSTRHESWRRDLDQGITPPRVATRPDQTCMWCGQPGYCDGPEARAECEARRERARIAHLTHVVPTAGCRHVSCVSGLFHQAIADKVRAAGEQLAADALAARTPEQIAEDSRSNHGGY